MQQGKRGGSGGVSDIKIQTRIPKMLNLVRTTAERGDPQAFPMLVSYRTQLNEVWISAAINTAIEATLRDIATHDDSNDDDDE